MLDNWLDDIREKSLLRLVREEPDGLGRLLLQQAAESKKINIAILSEKSPFSNKVREYLYGLSSSFPGLSIADLGTFRKPEPDFAIPVIRELLESNIIPIILASDMGFLNALMRAQVLLQAQLNLGLFAASPDIQIRNGKAEGRLQEVFQHADLAHFCLLGGQSHYIRSGVTDWLGKRSFDHLRLGAIRGALPAAEPYIRDADLIGFHLGCMKQIEAPAQSPVSPSGFFSEEACQLIRYAGMSDKLRAVSIGGYDSSADLRDQTASLTAQLIWYFIDGVFHRKEDFPVSKKNLVEYIVQSKEWNAPLVFWKSNKSGRWWLQLPRETKAPGRHHLVPCSYEDYLSCTNDELPDRLLQRLQREFN